MIDFGNIQAAAVKSIYKNKEKGRPQEYIVWGEKNGIVPISYQSIVIFFVPEELCLLKSPETGSKKLVTDSFIEYLSEIKEEHKLKWKTFTPITPILMTVTGFIYLLYTSFKYLS